jgi:DNA modification methylase
MKMAEKVVIGNAELWHGDCREVLPLLKKHDLLLIDPPYGLGKTLHKAGGSSRWDKHYDDGVPEWDHKPAYSRVLQSLELARDAIVWGGQFYGLPGNRCMLTWNKIIRNWSSSEAEHAWTTLDKPNRVFDYSHGQLATEGKHYHPTQKPVPLMAWCLDEAKYPLTVLDSFMGAGSTGVACAQLGLAFTGIEMDRRYFDAACERISRAQAQGTLLPPEETRQPVQEGLL